MRIDSAETVSLPARRMVRAFFEHLGLGAVLIGTLAVGDVRGVAGAAAERGGARNAAAVRFTEVTGPAVQAPGSRGPHAVAWADIDDDGRPDAYVTNNFIQAGRAHPDYLLVSRSTRNRGQRLLEQAARRGVADVGDSGGSHGAVWVDYDLDGDFDLFNGSTVNPSTPGVLLDRLYENDGDGFFRDVTVEVGLTANANSATRGVAAGDLNGDGRPDLVAANPVYEAFNPFELLVQPPRAERNLHLSRRRGFRTRRGPPVRGFTQGVTFVHLNDDEHLDYAEATWRPPSEIYLGRGRGRFTAAGAGLGLPQDSRRVDNGVTFADVDTDGDQDLAIAGTDGVVLYRNTGGGFEVIQALRDAGGNPLASFHASFVDVDHDGDLDLYPSGDDIWLNDGRGRFTRITTALSGLAVLDPRAASWADYDGDGDRDVLIGDKARALFLVRNDTDPANRWLELDLIAPTGERGALGARVSVYRRGAAGRPGALLGVRQAVGAYGYLGQDDPVLHFGVGRHGKVDVVVRWHGGGERVLSRIRTGMRHVVDGRDERPPSAR